MIRDNDSIQLSIHAQRVKTAISRIRDFTELEAYAKTVQKLSHQEILKAQIELQASLDALADDGENTGILLSQITSQLPHLSEIANNNI
jgi:type IV secretory pathway VirJ component